MEADGLIKNNNTSHSNNDNSYCCSEFRLSGIGVCCLLDSSGQPYRPCIVICPILEMRKLRLCQGDIRCLSRSSRGATGTRARAHS